MPADGFFSNLFGGSPSQAPAPSPDLQAPQNTKPPADTSGETKTPDVATLDGFGEFLANLQSKGETAGGSNSAPAVDLTKLAADPATFDKLASSLDFTAGVQKELLEQAKEGNTEALLTLMDHSAKRAYAQALQHAAMLSGHGIKESQSALPTNVQTQVTKALKAHQLEQATTGDSTPPATSFILKSLASGLIEHNPGMDVQSANAAARSLLQEMAASIAPKAPSTRGPGGKVDNWDEWYRDGTG